MTSARREKGNGQNAAGGEQVAPHDPEAEKGLLGAAMVHPGAVDVMVKRCRPDDFYLPQHRRIAQALWDLFHDGSDERIDAVSVSARVPADDHAYLISLTANETGVYKRHAERVHDLAVKRRLLAIAAEISKGARAPDVEVVDVVAKATSLVDQVTTNGNGSSYSSLEVPDFASVLAGDLTPESPTILHRKDGHALLYPGRMHAFNAEPSVGKTWIALTACAEVLDLGGAVIYIDFEDTAKGIAGRLKRLSVDLDAAGARFGYVNPGGPFGTPERHELGRMLDRLNPDLVVFDGVAEALARDGYDEDRNRDVAEWFERLPRPIARGGASVLLLDHVIKNREQRGRGARGAGHKLGGIDGAVFQLIRTRAFSRDQEGACLIRIDKDREGGIGPDGTDVATALVRPMLHGTSVEVELVSPQEQRSATAVPRRPTRVMATVVQLIESAKVDLTRSSVKKMLGGDDKTKERAIEYLVTDGYVDEKTVGRRKVLKIVRDFDPAEAEREDQGADVLPFERDDSWQDELGDF